MNRIDALHEILLSMITQNGDCKKVDYRIYSYYKTKQINLSNRDLTLGLRIIKNELTLLLDKYDFTLHIVGDSDKKEQITYTFSTVADRNDKLFIKFDDSSFQSCLETLKEIIKVKFKDGEDICLFKITDIPKMVNRVKELLHDDKKREEIARRGYEKAVRKHTWDVRAKQLVEFVEKELKNRQ